MPKLPPVKRRDFEKYLEYHGYFKKRQKGSHIVYSKAKLARPVIITADKTLSFTVVRNCLKTMKRTTEDLEKFLKNK